jgi:5-methylcytosine-specific restriction protein A
VLAEEFNCALCGRAFSSHLRPDVHHIVPVRLGGTNDRENLRAICRSCHARISTKSRKQRQSGYQKGSQ